MIVGKGIQVAFRPLLCFATRPTFLALQRPVATMTPPTISLDLLKQQNAETSNALIAHFKESPAFDKLAKAEGAAILARDQEDAEKLQKGIDYAKEKGVLDPNFVPAPYTEIDVLGKTPDQVASDILGRVQAADAASTTKNSVIVLCGLSGTGKGTTVAKLRQKLEETSSSSSVVTWSNGNIFRSVTLLAATWWQQEQEKDENLSFDAALTKENIESFMKMLSFGKFKDGGTKFDIRINGLGLDLLVSEVQNTTLKSPLVSKYIPTVAAVTQGEVILFASQAVQQLSEEGIFVLLEGREQTVNYVLSPHRFTVTLSDPALIGKRRAAQRLMGEAIKRIESGTSNGAGILDMLQQILDAMVKEIE